MKNINYFDLGLGPHPHELQYMINDVLKNFSDISYKAYGIDAHPDYVKTASNIFNNNNNVEIYNLAISNKKGTERLYLESNTKNGGLGNSIFKTKNNVDRNTYLDVQSNKFSSFLQEKNINLKNSINVLKVNIEGAELYLCEDFKQNDLRKYFHIICGYKDHDIYKVNELKEKYHYYDSLIKELNIEMVHFCHYGGPDRSISTMKNSLSKVLC